LQDCRISKEYEKIIPTAGSPQKPDAFIRKPTESWRELTGYDDDAMDKMQESIRLILSIKRAISSIEPSEDLQYMGEPLLPLVDKFLKDNNEPIPLHLVFGYEMLLSSYKAFMWLNQTINNQNCRILV
jgi:hypothetical protein